jgi:hypothetical protein
MDAIFGSWDPCGQVAFLVGLSLILKKGYTIDKALSYLVRVAHSVSFENFYLVMFYGNQII